MTLIRVRWGGAAAVLAGLSYGAAGFLDKPGMSGHASVLVSVLSVATPVLFLEAVMNSIENGLGMRETKSAREPSRPWNPHFYAIFAQVHNTL
jgi:hypothetical protein